jgi:pyruvate dehydrogenase E1 component beta subunit
VIDTPITEQGFAGARRGRGHGRACRPIVEFMTWNFAMQAIDQIINSAGQDALHVGRARSGCPIVFRGPNGAGGARCGTAQPELQRVVRARARASRSCAPYASPPDAKGLLKAAIRDPNPVIVLENEICYGRSFEVPVGDDHLVPIGKAARRAGGTRT